MRRRSGGTPARIVLVAALSAAAGGAAPSEATKPDPHWRALEPGLELGGFGDPSRPAGSPLAVQVLRIDPARFELRLLNASAPGQGRAQSARDWCENNDMVAAINASMYQTDHRSSVSLMLTRAHVNNPRLSKDKTVLAFDPIDPQAPPVKLLDRECDDFEAERRRYGALVQSIRMLSCKGRNVWAPQPRRWSTAAIGTDGGGRVLFIHARPPYATHDLINLLTRLPLGLSRLMYVEGGREAQLFVRGGGREYEFLGTHDSGPGGSEAGDHAWPVPNVVAVARRGV